MAPFFLLFFLLCSPLLSSSPMASSLNPDVTLLLQIKSTLSNGGDGGGLSTWSNSTPLCAWSNLQWTFTTNSTLLDCSSPSLATNPNLISDPSIAAISISLPSSGLLGSIPASLSSLSSLQTLDLSGNNLTGGIPALLGQSPSLAHINLASNQLSGAIPASLWSLCTSSSSSSKKTNGGSDSALLRELRLERNEFSGYIPSPPSSVTVCPNLQAIDLSYNSLSGPIPGFLGSSFAAGLSDLNLRNNTLSGAIPGSLAGLTNLTQFDVSNNNLSGPIPGAIKASNGAAAYAGNPLLCGAPLEGAACAETITGHLDKRVVAALVIGAMAVAVVGLAICVAMGHRHNWGRDVMRAGLMKRELADGGGAAAGEDDVGDGKLIRFEGGEHLNVEEVLNAPGEVLGKTSYGTVYKAKLGGGGGGSGGGGGGGMIALRLLREDTVKDREEFMVGIRQIGQIRYPNVVSLLAYYAGPKGEKLLVYNYLSRGSLADLLYNRSASRAPLTWARRHKIALGAARGLAHLHHGLHSQLVHGNLKAKNIIVDESFEGHLADYGLPLLMNPGSQAEMLKSAASQGYKAPELIKMSRANPKTDVYNFGIILLEILTGKKPRDASDSSASDKQHVVDLPVYVKQAILEERASDLFDLEILSGMRSAIDDGLVQTLQLAMGCCAPSPMVRPDIKEVVRRLEDIRPKLPTPLYTPMGMKSPRDFIV